MKNFKIWAIGLAFWGLQTLFAAIIGESTANNIALVGQPSMSAPPLTMLKLQQRFYVVGKSADNAWLKVMIPQTGGATISGWVLRSSVKLVGQTPNAAPTPSPQFAQRPVSPTPAPYIPPPRSNSSFNQPPAVSSSQSSTSRRTGSFTDVWLSKKLKLSAGIGYLVYDHRVSTRGTSPGQLFNYRVSGAGLDLNLDYDFAELTKGDLLNGNLSLGSNLHFVYGQYSTKTGLKDTSNPPQTISTLTSKSKSNQLDFKLVAAYKLPFGSQTEKPKIGMNLGYQRLAFKGDDIQTLADKVTNITTTPDGVPDSLGMYVSHTTSGVLTGLFTSLPMGNLKFDLGSDFLLLSKYTENPGNGVKTGDKAVPKIAFLPYIHGTYTLLNQHYMTFAYNFRFQSVGFQGAGQRVTSNIADGITKTLMHQLSIGYQYAF